jgi:phosphorylcholine metabolism protein LicD
MSVPFRRCGALFGLLLIAFSFGALGYETRKPLKPLVVQSALTSVRAEDLFGNSAAPFAATTTNHSESLAFRWEQVFDGVVTDIAAAIAHFNTSWWITEGTLFGALRAGGNFRFTPDRVQVMDTDIDVMVEIESEAQWTTMRKAIEKYLRTQKHSEFRWTGCFAMHLSHRETAKLTCYTDAKMNFVPYGVSETLDGGIHVDIHSYFVSKKLNRIAMSQVCLVTPSKCKSFWPFQAWGGGAPYRGLIASDTGQFATVKYGNSTLSCMYDPLVVLRKWNHGEYSQGKVRLPKYEYSWTGTLSDPVFVKEEMNTSPENVLAVCEETYQLYREGYASFYPAFSPGCKEESLLAGRRVHAPKTARTCEAFSKRRTSDCETASQKHYSLVLSKVVGVLEKVVQTPWWIVERSLLSALTFGSNFGFTPKNAAVGDSDLKFMVEIHDEADWARIKTAIEKELSGWSFGKGCWGRNDGIAPKRKSPKLHCKTKAKFSMGDKSYRLGLDGGAVDVDFHSYVVSKKLNRIAMDPVCLDAPSKCKTNWPFQVWGGAAPYRGLIVDFDGKFSKVKFGKVVSKSIFDPITFLKLFNNKEYGSSNFHLQYKEFCLSNDVRNPLYKSRELDTGPAATLGLCEKSLQLFRAGYSSFYSLYSNECAEEHKFAGFNGTDLKGCERGRCKPRSTFQCPPSSKRGGKPPKRETPRPTPGPAPGPTPGDDGLGSGLQDAFGPARPTFVALLKAMANIFGDKIDYQIFGGTVLGYCRHKGSFIPYDDDVDLLVAKSDVAQIKRALAKWNEERKNSTKLGRLQYRRKDDVYKIFFENTPRAGSYSWNYPYIDLWTYTIKFYPDASLKLNLTDLLSPLPKRQGKGSGSWDHHWAGAHVHIKQGWMNYGYPYEYLFPTKEITLEGVKVRGPHEMGAYLDWEYGKTWRTQCIPGVWDHKNERDQIPLVKKISCQELADKRPGWKFSLGASLEQNCPKAGVPSPALVKQMTLQDENKPHRNTPFICDAAADTRTRQRAKALIRSFHKFAETQNISYWLCYGTALGQSVWNGSIPYDTDVDVYVLFRNGERLFNLSRRKNWLKSMYGAKLVVTPDFKKPHWEHRKYHRGMSVDFVAPIARYFRKGDDRHVDIWGILEHFDDPGGVPEHYLGTQHHLTYRPEIIPLNWVFPLRTCNFDGITTFCMNQQSLYLRHTYGVAFQYPDKMCVKNKWHTSTKCVESKCDKLMAR